MIISPRVINVFECSTLIAAIATYYNFEQIQTSSVWMLVAAAGWGIAIGVLSVIRMSRGTSASTSWRTQLTTSVILAAVLCLLYLAYAGLFPESQFDREARLIAYYALILVAQGTVLAIGKYYAPKRSA